jgi:hypothetical protein
VCASPGRPSTAPDRRSAEATWSSSPCNTDWRPDVRAALSQPLPEDPTQFNDLWNKLTPEEKDWLYSRDHNLGNHPGMPFDPKDHLGKDHYNRRHLDELIPQQQTKVDQMQHQFDDLARKAYMGDTDAAAAASNLAPQLQAAKHQLDGYKQVHDAVDPPPTIDGKPNKDAKIPRYLGMLDEQGHAAVAVGGNPDTATRNATFVPGTGQDLAHRPADRHPTQRVRRQASSHLSAGHQRRRDDREGGTNLDILGVACDGTRRVPQAQPIRVRPRRVRPSDRRLKPTRVPSHHHRRLALLPRRACERQRRRPSRPRQPIERLTAAGSDPPTRCDRRQEPR